MKSITTPYLMRASLLAGFAMVMGLALSFVVYHSTAKVKSNAIDLVENRIPILISINELIADLSEQERIIYEYYRSQNHEEFLRLSQDIRATFSMHLSGITTQQRFSEETAEIVQGQAHITQLFSLFYQAMQLDENNWDEMRDILTQVSTVRLELLPTLKSIEQQTKQTVDDGHAATLTQMARAHGLVVIYGVAILLIAGVVSWYIRQYVLTQAKNTRLALFSQKNPNPILSVNNVGDVVFANPACADLLQGVGHKVDDVHDLLPANFLALRQHLTLVKERSMVVEQTLEDRILQISIYWHEEMDAYDIHIKDVTQQKLAQEKVNYLAFYNQETHLPNQYKFTRDIDTFIRQGEKFSVGIFAIRDFESKVSTLGGEVTQTLVSALADIIAKALPTGIHFYQLTSGQFALLCAKRVDDVALKQLTVELSSVAEQAIETISGEFFIELDFGYSCFPQHSEEQNDLIKSAHMALVVATNNEHSNVAIYDSAFIEGIQRNNIVIDKLRHALASDALFLVFQPQLDVQSNQITGVETLVRWQDEDTIISPVEFIPLAEQSGLIVPIGEWILEQACLVAKALVSLGHQDIVVAVNVSPRQFSHPNFYHSVQSILQKVQLPAKNLELEITEGVFMHNEENTLCVLQQLKSLGLQLSIDDFGTGYSSLSYLKRFPIDKLKIDQSFIRDCHNNDEDKAIVKTIISLGKSLGLSLIAEGVEEASHVDFLKALGCDEIQGYWFSRPINQAQLQAKLQVTNTIATNNAMFYAAPASS